MAKHFFKIGKHSPAFSLIEVSFSLIFVALLSGGLLQVFQEGTRLNDRFQEEIVAYHLASEVLDQYSDWSLLTPLDGVVDVRVDSPVSRLNFRAGDPPTLNNVTYNITLNLADVTGFTDSELTQMTAQVDWGTNKSISLTTYKANY